jgi:hypothetical protein
MDNVYRDTFFRTLTLASREQPDCWMPPPVGWTSSGQILLTAWRVLFQCLNAEEAEADI